MSFIAGVIFAVLDIIVICMETGMFSGITDTGGLLIVLSLGFGVAAFVFFGMAVTAKEIET